MMICPPATAGDDQSLTMLLSNTPAGASQIRKQLMSFARFLNVNSRIIEDFELALGEALANAAEHGGCAGGSIRLEARISDDRFEALVSDDGPGYWVKPISEDHPPALAPRGYGLFLMQALMDEVEFTNEGKTVRIRKQL